MYLKRLELYGFKSFADRTELEFVPGVTAVVGPNGSGKSNVSDSIRWVLGEQSAKSLRGARMEDIIFAGSESRKPVNYGEVTLVLDNTDGSLPIDYAEVAITRRVYRSGESEYMLNKQSCRLKDITELFMDTGLGKDAYSIIGQGRIEEILSTKSEDRRGIFEEAAGVVKYKNRKKEAERKLQETEANLLRIQDITYELEEQLQPLKEQAEKAKRFKELKERLTKKEIGTYVFEIEVLHAKWQEATDRLDQLKAVQQKAAVMVSQEDSKLQKTKWEVSQLEQKLEQFQQELLFLTEEVEKLEGQREVLKERQKNFSSNREEMLQKIDGLEKRRAGVREEYEQKRRWLNELNEHVEAADKELQKKEADVQHMVQGVDDKLESLKAEYIDQLNEQASAKNDLRYFEQHIDQNEQRMKRLETNHGQYVGERHELKEQIAKRQSELNKFQQQFDALRQAYEVENERRKTLLLQIEQDEDKYRDYVSQYEKLKARKQMLISMKEEFAGFFQGVKEVLKARGKQLHGIDGAVAELIQVAPDYQMAIETALGIALQHVIVEHERAAREAIAFLKQRKLGRATFLPRSVMKSRKIKGQDLSLLKESSSFVGIASELISYEAKFASVIENLLGHVIVTKELKAANELAKRLHYRYRIVTLDGDVVNPGGSMTGGSVKSSQSNLLGRERDIKRLTVELDKVTKAIDEKRQTIRSLKQEVAKCEAELERYRQEGDQYKEREQALRDDIQQLRFQKQSLDEKLVLYDQDRQTFLAEIEQYRTKKEQCLDKLERLSTQSAQHEREIRRLEQEKQEAMQRKEKQSEEITQLKIVLARKIQEYEGVKEQVDRLEQESKELEREWQEAMLQLRMLEGHLHEQGDEEQHIDRTLGERKERKETLTKQIYEWRQDRKRLQQAWDELEIKLKELRRELKQAEDRAHQEEVQVNRLDVELENHLTLLREEYGLSYELAKEKYPLETEYEQVKREVEQLKWDIQRLGTVNLGAIEEYERLLERYEFLNAQEADLNDAKKTLYEVIAEMDDEMTKRFKSTFDLVRGQFQDVFQQLFGGGKADLILSDPDDLLNTGVDIVAQPPGKKLQHLTLLSGGEKALTAIALLFAILRIKPVPFCVLDEVEAALDEANVTRFAQYLREFAQRTQFIVITHRKGTMEGADVLYGVTMQELGVSKIVSVKLEDREDLITA